MLEAVAPLALQEDYDNCGLQVGSKSVGCTGVLLCVDVTPAIVDEAVSRGCNLIVSHHPLIFKGLKRLTGATLQEVAIIHAISAGISIYSSHTCLDNAPEGVSHEMARRLGLENVSVLDSQSHQMMKLVTMVPDGHVEQVRRALFAAGAGELGEYDSCSYGSRGEGTFRAKPGAHPFVGRVDELHVEPEIRLEVLLPAWRQAEMEEALRAAHPYEEPAYDFIRLENRSRYWGSGVVGEFRSPVGAGELVERVKTAFGSPVARCTALPDGAMHRVALCGGSGSFLIPQAIARGAQAIVTSDVKYHDFVDYGGRILIIDIGHYESERCAKDIFYRAISEKIPNFAVYYAENEKNPINYK